MLAITRTTRALRPAVRRLAQDAHKKGDALKHGDDKTKGTPLIVPLWKTTAEFKTLSDLPPREVLKAELLQMAEQKNGFLFGEVPPPPGQARKWEDWELIWYVGIGASFLYAGIGLYFKPDCKIQTWARAEALRRKAAMEENGEDWLALMREGGSAPPLAEA